MQNILSLPSYQYIKSIANDFVSPLILFTTFSLIISFFILNYVRKYFYEWYADHTLQPIKKFPVNLEKSDWETIDKEIGKRVPKSRFDNLPADLAILDLESWLNYRLGRLTKNIPRKRRNFKAEWKAKLTSEVRKKIKGRDYFKATNCPIEDLKDYVINMHSQKENFIDYVPEERLLVGYHSKFPVKYNRKPITVDEFILAIDINGIASDEYHLSYSVIKKLPSIFPYIITLFDKLNSLGTLSSEWKNGLVFFEQKPGKDLSKPESYRQLIRMPLMVRIYHRIFTNRMYNYLIQNSILNTHIQKGFFRNFCGCQENILIVKELLRDAQENNKTISVLFLDIQNAYGSLKKSVMNHVLESYKFPKEIINYVKLFYSDNKATITVANKNHDVFDWNVGVYQGCSLSNIMFITSINIILTYIHRSYKNLGYSHKEINTIIIAFVDDLLLTAKNRHDLLIVYKDLKDLLNNMGLKIKPSKSRILEINQNEGDLILEGNIVKVIDQTVDFKHLGTYLSSSSDSGLIIDQYRIDLEKIFDIVDVMKFKGKQLKDYHKFLIYKTNILPKIRWVFISEQWEEKSLKQIESIQIKYLKKWGKKTPEIVIILNNIRLVMKKSQERLYTNSIDNRIKKLSLELFGENSDTLRANGEHTFQNPNDVRFLSLDDTDYRAAIV